jgi:hypothetical protein
LTVSVADYESNSVSEEMDRLPTLDQKETQYAAISGPPMNSSLLTWSRDARLSSSRPRPKAENGAYHEQAVHESTSPGLHTAGGRVAIIGGGVTRALTAARLAARKFDVILLEKAGIGNGSSSRSMAGIRAQFGVEETVTGMLFSEWWYVHFHELLHTPRALQQPVIKQNGYLFLYDNPSAHDAAPGALASWAHAQANVQMQRKVGLGVDLLTQTT